MFETNHMWLVKSLVRKTNIIKKRNSDNTQKWATKSKHAGMLQNSRGKPF